MLQTIDGLVPAGNMAAMVRSVDDPSEPKKVLGRRLQAWRKHRGLSQTELSGASGVSVDVIRSYEAGRNLPSITNMEKFSAALRVTIDRLVKEDPPVKAR